MARTALTVQQVVITGLTPAFTAANVDGHNIPNSGNVMLSVKTSGTACNVTVQAPAKFKGLALQAPIIALGATAEKDIGPFDPGAFNQTDGSVWVDFSAVTGVTVAARKI